jgi:hypothetical protein
LKDQTPRLQFIYGNNLEKDQDRIITTKDCQYYIDNISYSANENYEKYGLFMPNIFDGVEHYITISKDFRGKKFVYSQKVLYNAVLDKYVTEYKQGNTTWHCYEETEYQAPILISNLVTNSTF